MLRSSLSVLIGFCAAISSRPAVAADTVLAEALFREGKALMKSGDYTDACPKLAESYRQDAATGTLFALGICLEQVEQLASAWATYQNVIGRAAHDGRRDRAAAAARRATALEPRLSKLTLRVPAEVARLPGFSLSRDGAPLPKAAWGSAVPLDAGEHRIVAKADGRKEWQQSITIAAAADRKTVEVPQLEALPEPERRATARSSRLGAAPLVAGASRAEPAGSRASWPRWLGLGAGIAGAGGVAVGALFGLRAQSLDRAARANGHCDMTGCDAAGLELNRSARAAGTTANVLFVSGGALALGGLTLFWIESSKNDAQRAALQVSATVADGGANVLLRAGF